VYVAEGERLVSLQKAMYGLTSYDASSLLVAKRALADAVKDAEKFPF